MEPAVSGMGRVIVGVSGSPGSIPALRYAAGIARQEDVPLMAVHAWVPPGGDLAERRSPSPYLRNIWKQAAGQRLKDELGSAWGCIPDGLDVHAVVMRGEPGPCLVSFADSEDDLLVVGSGPRGWWRRIWRGHVSRYCLAHAHCPVLAVPPTTLAKRATHLFGRRELTVEHALREWADAKLGQDSG
jgi:nucleotide-binding universal stress UspA family protein